MSSAVTSSTAAEAPVIFAKNRFSVGYFSAVGTWAFNVDEKICAICREDLMAPPNGSTKESTPTVGTCGHSFHNSCIGKHLDGKEGVCPTCRLPWNFRQNTSLKIRDFSRILRRASQLPKKK